jgi:deoxyadenosine/deoxycytidine kinase
MENLRIGIVGNIGVGKSTLIESLKEKPLADILMKHYPYKNGNAKIHTFPEEFCPEVLDAFYRDPKKHAFIAQLEFLNGRLDRQVSIEQACGIVLEDRTIYEDYHIFGKAQKVFGHMSEEEFLVYQRTFNLMTERVEEPDLVVYLRASTETLQRRIKQRGRESEKSIPASYLSMLNGLYENFITSRTNSPVLIIDANEDKPISEYLAEVAHSISAKITELQLRISTPGISEWVCLTETEAALRVIEAERRLEDYLKRNPKLISVAGNVGLGKSTVTTLMHQSLRIKALYEKPEENPLLEKFLSNKKKYCYELQKHFLDIRAKQRNIGKAGDFSFVNDRSLPEDLLVFCRHFNSQGILSDNELDLLTTEFYKTNEKIPQADLMIVLHSRPELAWNRIQKRGRAMEVNGGWTYSDIKDLNKLYRHYPEEVHKCGFHTNPILKINAEQIDMTNRVHMGYLFEQCYAALTS